MNDNAKGSSVYELDYHDKTEPLKYVMYSDIDWNEDEKYAKNKMLKILANWKYIEEERIKLVEEEISKKYEEDKN